MSTGWLWLLPALPAATGSVLLVCGRRADRLAGIGAIAAVAITVVLALIACGLRPSTWTAWLPAAGASLPLGLSAAGASGPIAAVVAIVAALVLIYALAYIEQDEARARFFGFMALFLGTMELLVLSRDLLTLLIGWELVGACSYALIGFWYTEPSRTRAAARAFITTRAADLGLYFAAMAVFAATSRLDLDTLATLPAGYRSAVAAGLILAAAGKSAQLPFSGWLSGAMEGPTPVSALLHSAAMVAAGLVLLIKVQPLLQATPWAAALVVWLGIASALAAAVIALYQDDLKQVLAASTVSQYGYMFAAAGAGGALAAGTHWVNHAAFKALLFLVAGVLVHQGVQRFQQMHGLARSMRLSAVVFAVGAFGLAALPPAGGFFSKASMLMVVGQYSETGYGLLLIASFLTAAYAARAWFAAFIEPAGAQRTADTPRDPDARMVAPMILLAAAVLLLAMLQWPSLRNAWAGLWNKPLPQPIAPIDYLIDLLVALAGVVWIWRRHRRGRLVPMIALPRFAGGDARHAAARWLGLVALLDRIGYATLVAARALARFDERGVDAVAVRGVTAAVRSVSISSRRSDNRVIDGGLATLTAGLQQGALGLSRLQSGLLYHYYALLSLGMAGLFIAALALLGT